MIEPIVGAAAIGVLVGLIALSEKYSKSADDLGIQQYTVDVWNGEQWIEIEPVILAVSVEEAYDHARALVHHNTPVKVKQKAYREP